MSDAALECALRALRHRDRTELEIERYLRARGFSEEDGGRAIATLRRTGLVDDERLARARAASLADRGAGDALIRTRLEEAGVVRDVVDAAIATLELESLRAERIVSLRGSSPRTVRYLHAKGFSEDAVAGGVADRLDGELG